MRQNAVLCGNGLKHQNEKLWIFHTYLNLNNSLDRHELKIASFEKLSMLKIHSKEGNIRILARVSVSGKELDYQLEEDHMLGAEPQAIMFITNFATYNIALLVVKFIIKVPIVAN